MILVKFKLTKSQIQEALAEYVLRKRPRNNKGVWHAEVEIIGTEDMSEVLGATVTLTREDPERKP